MADIEFGKGGVPVRIVAEAIQLKPILILHCALELEKQARHGLVHLKQKLET